MRTGTSVGMVLMICGAAGCGGGSTRVAPGVRLTAGDFGAGSGAPMAAPGAARETREPDPASPTSAPTTPDPVLDLNAPGRTAKDTKAPEVIGPIGASGGITDAVGQPGTPSLGAGDPVPVGESVLVDAKIGDVNGKPIYASTFFDIGTPAQEPLGARLASYARQMSPREWAGKAREEIDQRLNLYIRDELLRAEALSTLSPERKQGLFAFVNQLQQDLRRESGGSREALKRHLEETEGISADEWARKREQTLLVEYEIQQKILRSINISWRDIEQAYNGRFYEQFHHPPRYQLYLVTMPASASEDRAQFEQGVAGGRPFAELAGGTLNRYKNDRGGLETREVAGDLAQTSFFPNADLDAAAKSLKVGETSPPVTMGDMVAWVHLARIDMPMGLYDAQLDIEQTLRVQRQNEALGRYLNRLRGKANVTSIPQMRMRLYEIAVARYAPRIP
ncbi:hypothetical protein PHYC_03575 [Phycisphaerales bacterium]|nr:hypothetical protein PHYC_03575 [Phycisphaerales bacterium]